jgi:hypothetical protein
VIDHVTSRRKRRRATAEVIGHVALATKKGKKDDGTHQSGNHSGIKCDGSIPSIASDGEIPDNFMQDATV